jgi:zinc protease
LLNPTFPADALDREKEIQLAHIRAQRDHMLQSGARAMRRALFGETAYGLDTLGTEESVTAIQTDCVKEFYSRLAAPNNCVLTIFGDVKADQVKAAVERLFRLWQKRDLPDSKSFSFDLSAPKRVTETRDKKQAVLLVGFPGVDLFSPDRYALELLQESCSDLGSRLFLRVREKLGLAYYVGAQHFMGLQPGYFTFYCGTAPEKVALVEKEFFCEAELLRSEGLTEEELKRSKAKIIGQKKISRQDLGTHATGAALDELYGLGFDFAEREDEHLESVTLDQIKAAAQKYLRSDRFVTAIVQPE